MKAISILILATMIALFSCSKSDEGPSQAQITVSLKNINQWNLKTFAINSQPISIGNWYPCVITFLDNNTWIAAVFGSGQGNIATPLTPTIEIPVSAIGIQGNWKYENGKNIVLYTKMEEYYPGTTNYTAYNITTYKRTYYAHIDSLTSTGLGLTLYDSADQSKTKYSYGYLKP